MKLTRIYSTKGKLDIMRRWTFLTISIIVILSFLPIGFQVLGDELSLQQVVDAVNFANMSIENAELRANLYISPQPPPKITQEKTEADLHRFKNQYQNASNPVEKQTLAQHIRTAEDLLNIPPLPSYYEYTIVFSRNEVNYDGSVADRLKSLYNYRMFRVNRASKHADPQFLDSIPQVVRIGFTGHEILTQINNGESKIVLTVNDRLDNTAYFDNPSFGLVALLLSGISVVIPINPERVIDFQSATQNGTTLYSIEYTPDIPGSALTVVGKLRSTRIQVNPSKGFSVTKKEQFHHVGGKKVLKSATRFDDFKLYSQGIWYPTSIHFTKYTEGQEAVEHLFEIQEADFNISIPPGFFHVQENEIRRLGIDILPNSH